MNDNDPQRDDLGLGAPGKFQEALKALHARRPSVPPEMDDAVMQAARRHLQQAISERRASRPTPTLWEELRAGLGFWLGARRWALASVVIVAGVLVWLAVPSRDSGLVEDLNRDGVVDMLDAFALARQLEQGQAPRPQHDVNGDGVVDGRDVQVLATRAVSLEAGGDS